ncbi:hypothetical protein [Methylobacterium iners]|uniref:Uncharacterized protein n=1 Tax=Methylobacterium iners TaxID=418707 RepID=A0ABQ4RZW3_9HYPH|nr:hypothetical protein [Methylobacterium iners]GJD95097.1 hypothetical protein OCOJLMKI_2306 [Methylobacterium iners]
MAAVLPVPRSADDDFGEPTSEERHALATTIAALESAGALTPGEVDAGTMWDAAQHYFPGEPVGFLEALASLAALHDHGFEPRRITFIPVHVEYDGELLAAITASILTSLGHEVGEPDVLVTLPRDDWEGEAVVTFPIEDRRESVTCHYRVKYPPPDLCTALAAFARADDPRELVCADPGYQMLLVAAIRPDTLTELNRRFPVGYAMFGPP